MSSRMDTVQTVTKIQDVKNDSPVAQIGQYLTPIILVLTDYIAIVVTLWIATYFRSALLPQKFSGITPFYMNETYLFFVIPLFYLSILAYEGMYTRRLPFWQSVEKIFKICTIVSVIVIVTMYFLKTGYVSRIFIVLSWALCFVSLSTSRYNIKRLLVALGLWQRPVVIIGAGKTAELLAKTFAEEPSIGYKIVGLIEDEYSERPLTQCYPYNGNFKNADVAIQTSGIKDVIIAAPGLSREELIDLVNRVQPYVKNLLIVPNLFGLPLGNLKIETLFNAKAILLNIQNNLASQINRAMKRFFDLVIGLIIFLMILPILCLLAVIIKLDSNGPVLHVANRLGKDGKYFLCYKFRTMYTDSDNILEQYLDDNPEAKSEWEKYAKLRKYDPRVTGVGQWMRKLSLDELPQIINVLKGEMSLVGPRPYLPREQENMGCYLQTILTTVPGITGLWQVSGRNEIDFEGRLQLDCWYVRNWSMWLDITLLFKTISVVLYRKGAY